MDVRIRIDWPELVEVVKQHLAARKEVPQRTEAPSPVRENERSQDESENSSAAKTVDTTVDVTLETVRAKLASLSQAGKQAEVKALITEFGAKKLSDVPQDKYPELLAKAEEIQ